MRKTEIRILQIFLGGISLLFGGFYEYTAYLSGIFLCLFLLWLWKRRGQLSFCFNITGIALAVLCLGYGLAVFWGVDRGMSFLGFLKVIPLLLFLLTVMQFTVQEKAEILKAVPWTGLLILGISMGAFVTGIGKSVFFLSGRLGGSFQYSNTMALYFLLGMVILFYLEKKRGRYRFFVFCLYMGILFTGSRSVFFLGALWLVFIGIKEKKHRWFHLLLLVLSGTAGILYVSFTGDYQNIGRFLTSSLHSSTFLGRILYWNDGIRILADHPLGLGYRGFSYIQGLYQTGVYQVQFIHNEYLQFMLDAGVLPGLFFTAALVRELFSGGKLPVQRMILILTAVHCLMDFDLQFLVMFCLLLLCADTEGRRKQAGWKKGLPVLPGAAGCLVWGYFSLMGIFFYIGQDEAAYQMFPWYTDAGERMLMYGDSLEKAEEISGRILSCNSRSAVAWSTRALLGNRDKDYEMVIESQRKAIALNPYEKQEYLFYLEMLEQGRMYGASTGNQKILGLCTDEMTVIPEKMEQILERTSFWGMQIQDRPDLTLPGEVQEYLEQLK